jgi:CRP-like cAMP-binding protein
MAPEQINCAVGEIDGKTDVFLLGGILYEILTHEPPYDHAGQALIAEKGIVPDIPRPETRVSVPLPSRLCDIAMRALQKEKSVRYQSVLHMKRDVEEFIQSGAHFERRIHGPGDIVCRENDEGREAFVIESGTCRVFKTVEGQKVPIRILHPGEVFGEIAVLTAGKRTASVEAVERLCLLVIKQSDFGDTLGMRPLLATFMRTLAKRFAEKDAKLTALEQENAVLKQCIRDTH